MPERIAPTLLATSSAAPNSDGSVRPWGATYPNSDGYLASIATFEKRGYTPNSDLFNSDA